MKTVSNNRFAAVLTVVYVAAHVQSEVSPKDADEIKSLPGWNQDLQSKHYSGYLSVANGTRHMHYYFQESENAPVTDPVTLWMNGGPGCTSLKGGFEELGQLVFNYKSMANPGTPTLSYNPYSWTTVSNLLMFESPPGVGFSYCDECVGNPGCKCNATDLSTASDNADALEQFFIRFPELDRNSFFITGESYAGMYIPTLMAEIDRRQNGINLQGAAIGNGVGGQSEEFGGNGHRIRAKFYYGKGVYPTVIRDVIERECGSLDYPTAAGWENVTDACNTALQAMNAAIGPHNLYNMQDFCPNEESRGATLFDWLRSMEPRADGSLPRMDGLLHRQPTVPGTPVTSSCATVEGASPLGDIEQWCSVDRSMMTWLADPAVVKALHMTGPKGTEDNNLHYVGGYLNGDLRALYKELALKYRLWIYNGQEDGCIPYTGAEEWTSHQGFPVATAWHPWFGGDGAGGTRVAAGYATQYGGAAKDFAFITVKGAGHEVPTYKPVAAYVLFTSFINGTAL